MLGVPAKGVLCALHGMKQVPGRMESVPLGEYADFRVLIDYAHTPDALEKLLRSVSELIEEQGRILLLFGCGGDRDRSKRREMAHIASRFADFVILTSDNSRTEDPSAILADIERGMDKEKPYTVIEDRKEAIAFGLSLCRRNMRYNKFRAVVGAFRRYKYSSYSLNLRQIIVIYAGGNIVG